MRNHKYLLIGIICFIIGYFTLTLLAVTGTPSTLRVRTDANNYLLVTAVTQTNPVTQGIFSTRTLRTDASGNLQVILTGTVTPSYPLSMPASTCPSPSLSLSGNSDTGIAFTNTPSKLDCIDGVAVMTKTATELITSLHEFIGTAYPSGIYASLYQIGTYAGDGTANIIDVTPSPIAIALYPQFGFTGNNNSTFFGIDQTPTDTGTGNLTGTFIGTVNQLDHSGAGILTNGVALSIDVLNNGGGIVNSVGLLVNGLVSTSSNLGIDIANSTSASTENVSVQSAQNSGNGNYAYKTTGSAPSTFADIETRGTVPAVSNTSAVSCGTTAATITGNDNSGVITVGTVGGTSCTMTFVLAAPSRRQCTVNNETTANLARATYTDTTHSVFAGTFVAGDKLSYHCFPY